MRRLILVFFFLGLSAESYAQLNLWSKYNPDTELYETVTIQLPEKGAEAEAYLGDSIVVMRVGSWKECITPRQTYYAKEAGRTMVYKEKEPLCKLSPNDKSYFPTYDNYTFYGPKPEPVTWKPRKKKSRLCSVNGWACAKKLPEDAVEVGVEFVSTEPTKTIEYSGKKGDIMSFIYTSVDPIKNDSVTTRQIDLDLTEGSILAFKGALVEVIEGNNMSIKYKVIRHFGD